jgi:O-antigen/teichoic acid export membrane protein
MKSSLLWLKSLLLSSEKGIRDLMILLVPQAAKAVSGFFTSVLLSRGLGPTGLGGYALILSLSDMVNSLSDLGIGQTALRYASLAYSQRDTDGQASVLRWAFRLRMLLVIVMVAALFVAAPFLERSIWHIGGLGPLIRMSLMLSILGAVASVPAIYFQSTRKFGMYTALISAQSLFSLLGVAILAYLNMWSVGSVIGVSIVAGAATAVLSLVFVPRSIWIPRVRSGDFKRITWRQGVRVPSVAVSSEKLDSTSASRFALFLLLSTFVVLVTLKLDVWLMGFFLNEREIGLYNAAARLALPLGMLLNSVTLALWPRMSALTSPAAVRSMFGKTLMGSVMLAGISLVYAAFVPLLAPLLFGPEFGETTRLCQILSVGYCVAILGNPVAVIGYSLGLAKFYWITNLIQMLFVIVLLVTLLPRIGALGAALTFVANALVGGIINGYAVWAKVRRIQES